MLELFLSILIFVVLLNESAMYKHNEYQIPYGYHYIVPCQVSRIGLDLRIKERDLPGSMSRSFRNWITK